MKTVLIPMAGQGSRFLRQGFELPKMLIPVTHEKTILEYALDGLLTKFREARWVFVCLEAHLEVWPIESLINQLLAERGVKLSPVFIKIEKTAPGQLCSAMIAKSWIDPEDWLIVHNCDTYISSRFDSLNRSDIDGALLVFRSDSSAYSYVRVGGDGMTTQVKEKQVLSGGLASTGTYIFKKGDVFIQGAEQAIRNDRKTDDEFYVSSIFDYLIQERYKFAVEEVEKMHALGTPEELAMFRD